MHATPPSERDEAMRAGRDQCALFGGVALPAAGPRTRARGMDSRAAGLVCKRVLCHQQARPASNAARAGCLAARGSHSLATCWRARPPLCSAYCGGSPLWAPPRLRGSRRRRRAARSSTRSSLPTAERSWAAWSGLPAAWVSTFAYGEPSGRLTAQGAPGRRRLSLAKPRHAALQPKGAAKGSSGGLSRKWASPVEDRPRRPGVALVPPETQGRGAGAGAAPSSHACRAEHWTRASVRRNHRVPRTGPPASVVPPPPPPPPPLPSILHTAHSRRVTCATLSPARLAQALRRWLSTRRPTLTRFTCAWPTRPCVWARPRRLSRI